MMPWFQWELDDIRNLLFYQLSFEMFIIYLSKTLIRVTILFHLYLNSRQLGQISANYFRVSFQAGGCLVDILSFGFWHIPPSQLSSYLSLLNLVNVFVIRVVCLVSATSASVTNTSKVQELYCLRKFHGQESCLTRDRV